LNTQADASQNISTVKMDGYCFRNYLLKQLTEQKVEKTLSVLQNLILSVDSLSATINDGFTQYLDVRLIETVTAFLSTELDPNCNVEKFTTKSLSDISTTLCAADAALSRKGGGGAAEHILWKVHNAINNLKFYLAKYYLPVFHIMLLYVFSSCSYCN
jgi:hypothetical protein